MHYLELLAPAKNADQGISAINHGADAVYIGAPAFGARTAACNSLEDIDRLVKYAHLYHSKVFTTVNTLLFDEELEDARRLICKLYEIGVDALIIQDMGILEMDLPPIELHASTQVHNLDVERIKFMEQVGFRRIILAREASLAQMRAIRSNTSVDLEAFVQGALCVCYSGQCYMSQYLNQRSGNRGCCSQPCRSTYDLLAYHGDESSTILRQNEHLLSLKDFNASQHIASMIDAGISSFKIEGRLKDEAYVKNVTSYYRQLLDSFMEGKSGYMPESQGVTRIFFTPDLERTFNRGFTSYCLDFEEGHSPNYGRQKMASVATQKSIGKYVGTMERVETKALVVSSKENFSAGDGLCFLSENGQLEGFNINHIERVSNNQYRITPNRIPSKIAPGSSLWRNNDFAFEKQLQGKTSERKLFVSMVFNETEDGFSLSLCDEFDNQVCSHISIEKDSARDAQKASEQVIKQLSKLGDSPFLLRKEIDVNWTKAYFLPSSILNELRRTAVEALIKRRIEAYHPVDCAISKNETPYFTSSLDYRANVINLKSEQFYKRHGVKEIEHGLEQTHDYKGKALMTTKYCLRYELGMCLLNPKTKERGELVLRNNKNLFKLHFDCAKCQMEIYPIDK